MSQQDLEKLVEADIRKYPLGGEPGSQSQDQFWREMGVNIQRKDETVEGTAVKPVTGSESSLETLLGVKAQKVRDGQGKREANKEGLAGQIDNTLKPGQATDIYEQMKIQFGKPLDTTQGKPSTAQDSTCGKAGGDE